MAVSGPSLQETIESFSRRLGIVAYDFRPYITGPGHIVHVTFKCSVCRQRWTHEAESGPVEDVVRELCDVSEAHQCQLELAPFATPPRSGCDPPPPLRASLKGES